MNRGDRTSLAVGANLLAGLGGGGLLRVGNTFDGIWYRFARFAYHVLSLAEGLEPVVSRSILYSVDRDLRTPATVSSKIPLHVIV